MKLFGGVIMSSGRDLIMSIEKLKLVRRICMHNAVSDLPIYHGQLPMLEYIYRHDGCTQAELAEQLMITPASAAMSTKRLEKSGLITKSSDESNLRRNNLSLTKEGIDICLKCREAFDGVDSRMLMGFSEDEMEQCYHFISRLIYNLIDKDKLEEIKDAGMLELAAMARMYKNGREGDMKDEPK